jgi:uncharacterized protein YggE
MFGIKQAAALLSSFVFASLFASEARAQGATDKGSWQRTVSVSASARVNVEPDVAVISAGVVTEAETAREALARNSAAMGKVIDGLKAAGINSKDIQTTAVNVEPRYQTFKDGRPSVITGYRVANRARVTMRDLKRVGELLDSAIALGANEMGGIAFRVSNMEALKDEARKAAMANAVRRAKLYAAAVGATLGPVLTISEDMREPAPFAGRELNALRAASVVPVEAGSQELEVEVHVTWALQ